MDTNLASFCDDQVRDLLFALLRHIATGLLLPVRGAVLRNQPEGGALPRLRPHTLPRRPAAPADEWGDAVVGVLTWALAVAYGRDGATASLFATAAGGVTAVFVYPDDFDAAPRAPPTAPEVAAFWKHAMGPAAEQG